MLISRILTKASISCGQEEANVNDFGELDVHTLPHAAQHFPGLQFPSLYVLPFIVDPCTKWLTFSLDLEGTCSAVVRIIVFVLLALKPRPTLLHYNSAKQ